MTSNYQAGVGYADNGLREDIRIANFRLRQAIVSAARLGLPSEIIINLGVAVQAVERASEVIDHKNSKEENSVEN